MWVELVKGDYGAAQRHLGNALRAECEAEERVLGQRDGSDKRLTAGDPGMHAGLNVALTCVQDRWGLPPEGDSDWGGTASTGMLGAMAMKKFKEGWREGSWGDEGTEGRSQS